MIAYTILILLSLPMTYELLMSIKCHITGKYEGLGSELHARQHIAIFGGTLFIILDAGYDLMPYILRELNISQIIGLSICLVIIPMHACWERLHK